VYFFNGGDLVNQEKHAKRKKEGNEVFQDGLKDEADIQGKLESITLEEGNHGAEGHTHQQKRSRHKEHEKIDGPSPQKTSISFDAKDNIEGAAQRIILSRVALLFG